MIQESNELAHCGFSSRIIGTNGKELFNNGHIAIAKDWIFGLSVWDGQQFVPISLRCDLDDIQTIKEAIASGTMPFPWYEELNKVQAELEAGK